MENITLFCSGYSGAEGNDIITVSLNPDGTGTVTGGRRQGSNPSFCLCRGGLLYTISELEGEAYIECCRIEKDEKGRTALLSAGKRIRVPGGELCHLHAGDSALYGSCYGSGDFCAVDYGLTEILWHRGPQEPGVSHAHWVSQADGVLYLSDLGSSRIFRYCLEKGLPGRELPPLVLNEGAGPRQALGFGDGILSVQELDGTLCLWKKAGDSAEAGDAMECVQKVKTTVYGGENYPGTICLADEKTVLVCNRGANTVAAFGLEENRLFRIGEWATGNWPRYITRLPGTSRFINACNKEGKLILFCWENRELVKTGEISLPGASCAGTAG